MTSNDAIQDVRDALAKFSDYENRYHPNEPVFRQTYGRLAETIGRLADEVERLRDQVEGESDIMGGDHGSPFGGGTL